VRIDAETWKPIFFKMFQLVQNDMKLMKETDVTEIIECGGHFLPPALYRPTIRRVKLLFLPSDFHISTFLSKFPEQINILC
jgi:hypothetical protein